MDRFLSFLNFAVLYVTKAERLMVSADRYFAAQYLSVLTKLGVHVHMVPLHFFKSFDEDGGALNIFATWLSSDGMRVVGKRPADLARLNDGISVLFNGSLCVFDRLKHHEGVVELFEKRSRPEN